MNEFTRQELGYLCQMFKVDRTRVGFFYEMDTATGKWVIKAIPEIIKHLEDNPNQLVMGSEGPTTLEEFKKTLFDRPLRDMPLLLDTPVLKTVALWRMKIRK